MAEVVTTKHLRPFSDIAGGAGRSPATKLHINGVEEAFRHSFTALGGIHLGIFDIHAWSSTTHIRQGIPLRTSISVFSFVHSIASVALVVAIKLVR